jgi:chorismate mutase/prephenate dehydratase
MRNEPGALHNLLEPFHRHNIDLTRVETRPSRTGVWTYVFFIDFAGHANDPLISEVLQEVATRCADLKLLGSYPKAVL